MVEGRFDFRLLFQNRLFRFHKYLPSLDLDLTTLFGSVRSVTLVWSTYIHYNVGSDVKRQAHSIPPGVVPSRNGPLANRAEPRSSQYRRTNWRPDSRRPPARRRFPVAPLASERYPPSNLLRRRLLRPQQA